MRPLEIGDVVGEIAAIDRAVRWGRELTKCHATLWPVLAQTLRSIQRLAKDVQNLIGPAVVMGHPPSDQARASTGGKTATECGGNGKRSPTITSGIARRPISETNLQILIVLAHNVIEAAPTRFCV
jgi:hypothetical protein